MQDEPNDSDARANVITMTLAGLIATGLFLGSMLLCGGLALYFFGIVLGLTIFGYLHYLVWGQALSQEVEGEREEQEARLFLEMSSREEGSHHREF
ncbi:MAG: hypothetical protein KatS3mg105_4495 [Gemmatales bacterium]|nr:MAG: hypothetical protein KatS3mg105_4495 [Gemmatales bacterium]